MTMLAATALAAAHAGGGVATTYTTQEAEELATLLGAAAAGLMQPAATSAPWSPSSAFTQFPPAMRLGPGGSIAGADLWRNHALLQPFSMDNPFAQGQHGDGGAGASRGHRQSLGTAGGAGNATGAPSRSGKRKPAGTAGARSRGGGAANGGGGAAERGGGMASGQPPPAKRARKATGAAAAAPKAPRKRAGAAAGGGDGGARRDATLAAFSMPGPSGLPLVPRPTAPRGAPPPLKSLLDDVEAFEESVPDVSKPTCSRSRSWNPEEDETVRALVREHGLRKWAFIAACLKTKTQKQVYARWRDYLQPSLTTKPWTKEEQKRLLELQAQIGNQWAQLAQLMPGRSPNAIKNRFHATKRKLERHTRKGGGHGAAGPPRVAAPAAAVDDDDGEEGDELEDE